MNTPFNSPRRRLLQTAGCLSAGGLALLAGVSKKGLAAEPLKDADVLNVILGLEHQLIAAYQIGADSGLLKQSGLNISLLFQSHHKGHRDTVQAALQKIGGTPVQPKLTPEYAKNLGANDIKSQTDFLNLAVKLELGAINAYIGIMPTFSDRELTRLNGRLVADETMHWTALQSTLLLPLPAMPLTFGA